MFCYIIHILKTAVFVFLSLIPQLHRGWFDKNNLNDYLLFYINIYFIIFVSPEKCGGMEVSLSPVNRGDKKQITQVCYLYIYCYQTDINKTYKNYDYKLCEFGTWMVLIFYSKKDHVKTDKVKKITFSLTIERQSSFKQVHVCICQIFIKDFVSL